MLTWLFNGLDVLVARDEGLFEAEGVDLRIATASVRAPAARIAACRGSRSDSFRQSLAR